MTQRMTSYVDYDPQTDVINTINLHGLRRLSYGNSFCPRRVLWSLILIGGAVACAFEVYCCVHYYISAQTSVITTLVDLKAKDLPKITICNTNPFRLTVLDEVKWIRQLDNIITSSSSSSSTDKQEAGADDSLFNTSSRDVFFKAAHQAEHMIIRCSYRGKMCYSPDFQMTILAEHGVCYTLNEQYVEENREVGKPDAGEYVNILFDAESYEGLSRWNGGESGVKVILHHASSYPTFTSKVIYLQPGAVNHVTLQATSILSPAVNCQPDAYDHSLCVLKCISRSITAACHCRPFWESNIKNGSYCSIGIHFACVQKVRDTIAKTEQCECSPPCRSVTYDAQLQTTLIQSLDHTFSNVNHAHGKQQRVELAVALTDGLSIISLQRDKSLARSVMTSLDDVINTSRDVQTAVSAARSDVDNLLRDLQPRVAFHANVAWTCVLRMFDNGFASAWDSLEQFALRPLQTSGTEIVMLFNKTTEQLRTQARNESHATTRRALHLLLDTLLEAHMELADKVLDNLTRVHDAFLNAEPLAGYPAVTRGKRYDLFLVPSQYISRNIVRQKSIYDGLTQTITDYMQDVVSLRHLAKQFLLLGGGSTKEDMDSARACRSLSVHSKQMLDHVTTFRESIVRQVRTDLENIVTTFRDTNSSLYSTARDSFSAAAKLIDSAADDAYKLLQNNFTQIMRDLQEMAHSGGRKLEVMQQLAAGDMARGLLQLRMLTWSLNRDGRMLIQRLTALRDATVRAWNAILNDDILRNFYFQLNRDAFLPGVDVDGLLQLRKSLTPWATSTADVTALNDVTDVSDARRRLNADVATILFERQVREIDDALNGVERKVTGAADALRHHEETLLVAMEALLRESEDFSRRTTVNSEFLQKYYLRLIISAAPQQATQYTEDYNYKFHHLLGDLGGLVSLFLGISLLTVLECADVILTSLFCSACSSPSDEGGSRSPLVHHRQRPSPLAGVTRNGHRSTIVANVPLRPPAITVSSDSEDNQIPLTYLSSHFGTPERGTRC